MLVVLVVGTILVLNYIPLRHCLGREIGCLFYFIIKWQVTLLFLSISLFTPEYHTSTYLYSTQILPWGGRLSVYS